MTCKNCSCHKQQSSYSKKETIIAFLTIAAAGVLLFASVYALGNL